MCGIAGIVDFENTESFDAVEAMTSRLIHRGPDMGATHFFQNCALGHRRLSILDLSDSAIQPMVSADGQTAIVFNGEIYNFKSLRSKLESKGYRFKTSSDTEVALYAFKEFGEEMIEMLNGMFSLAIWNNPGQSLLLARDRLGKKPLYYCISDTRLSFASELYSLMADPSVPRDVNSQALFEYFMYDFIPAPHSVFRYVVKLPAAHKAVFSRSGLRVEPYWRVPGPEGATDYDKKVEELRELIRDATQLRMVSDVPLGAFLSGGLDSSLVTALMKSDKNQQVKTFSMSFPKTSHDESKWSRLAAKAFNTDHTESAVTYNIEEIFPKLAYHFGEPFGDSSALPTWILSQKTREKVTVALSGDGGDELFGGYERYLARKIQTVYEACPQPIRRLVVEPLVRRAPETTNYYGTSLMKKLKLFVNASERMRNEPLALIPRTFSKEEVHQLTGFDYDLETDPVIETARAYLNLGPVQSMMFTDLRTYLGEDILTKVDRMSMAHSLEVRSPLLDYRVVEMACRLPLSYKISGMTGKRILKDVASGLVPKSIIKRSKYGFQVPLGEWFRKDLRQWAGRKLFERRHSGFNTDFIKQMWTQHLLGKQDNTFKIWLLLIYMDWESSILFSS